MSAGPTGGVTQNNRVDRVPRRRAAPEEMSGRTSGAAAVRAATAALEADATADGAQQLSEERKAAAELASATAASNLGYLDGVITFCGGRYNAVTVS